ncbi:host cell division inhibitor Icd-like protein [Escherichia coli]|nr:host cell division inhibitor Icd-like protein [Escherichia coli]
MTDITKSAPLPERPCEQLTRCALCICDPDHKHADDSRYQAGGQGYQPGGRFLPDLRRRGHFAKKSSMANLSGLEDKKGFVFSTLDNSASSRSMVFSCFCRMISSSCVCVSCFGDSVLLVIVCTCKAMRRSTSHHGADSDYSDSLAFRRWRRLISPRMAAFINCPVLSPSSFTLSMPSIISWAIRAVTDCDFAFFGPVAMFNPLCFWCKTIYTKKKYFEGLTCKTPLFYIVSYTLSIQGSETAKPVDAANTYRLLTTNDNESIEAAMRNHTTHPQGRDSHNLNKYIWRFIALSTAQPRVIHIVATSEQEARQQSPDGCVMVFAARIRQGSHHA